MKDKLIKILTEYYQNSCLKENCAQFVAKQARLIHCGETFNADELILKLSNSEINLRKIAELTIQHSKEYCDKQKNHKSNSLKKFEEQLIAHNIPRFIQSEEDLTAKIKELLAENDEKNM